MNFTNTGWELQKFYRKKPVSKLHKWVCDPPHRYIAALERKNNELEKQLSKSSNIKYKLNYSLIVHLGQ
jgi:hypothetical protein